MNRIKLTINLANLVSSVTLIVVFVGLALTAPGGDQSGSGLCCIPPKTAAWYFALGVAGRAGVMVAALCGLVLLLILFLLSFKLRVEDYAFMVLGIPFYLLLGMAFLSVVGFIVGLARWGFGQLA